MDRRDRHPLTRTFALFSSVAFFSLLGSARAETPPPAESEKAGEASTAAPAPEAADKVAAPAPDTGAQAAPAAPAGEASTEAAPAAPPPEPPAPAAPAVEWKVQSKGGMMIASGNAQSRNFTFGVNGFRKEGNNKLTLEGGLSYGTTNVLVARTDTASGTTTVDREQTTSTNNMAAKGRYDRFLTEHNTAYASGQVAADKIAGKTFFGGGQLGYSRLLVKDNWNIVVAELGYDFSYERYVQPAAPAAALDPITIHSARILVGETLSLSKETGITVSVEALFNLNKETKAVNVKSKDGSLGVDAFKDTRVNAKVGLSTNLWKSLSFGFSFTLKYDQNPAPRPVPRDAPSTFSFAKDDPNYYSDEVDTITEATFIYTFF